jgi:hypothetical protein
MAIAIVFFFSSRRKEKKTWRKKKCKEGRELTFLLPVLRWDEALLSPFPLHLPQALRLASPQSFELLMLGSSSKLWRWSEREMR